MSPDDLKQADAVSFRERIAQQHMAPLWDVFKDLVRSRPGSGCRPALWHYDDVRPAIIEAGDVISASEAERRVLILENPGLTGQSRITTSLYAGLQLVLPGEVAPAHRHAQSALRFVIEGSGGYTTVDGEKAPMAPGDFIITPAGCWHDHGNDGNDPVVWLDGLDIPIVSLLDASYVEHHPNEAQPIDRPIGDALARYGSGLLPFHNHASTAYSPVFHYPYSRTATAVDQLRGRGEVDLHQGLKLTYVNPMTGGPAMPGIEAFVQGLIPKTTTRSYRSTDATVFSVVEGRGQVHMENQVLEWSAHDTFVIPSWYEYRLEAFDEVLLFGFSDRPLQRHLGIWREARA